MLPAQLTEAQFSVYPPLARAVAVGHLPLFRQLSLSFVPLLFRELISYDWKFPVERRDLDRQIAYLESLPPGQLQRRMTPFAQLQLTTALEQTDWVGSPTLFSEQLTAHLWATHQIDKFRTAAVDYMQTFSTSLPEETIPLPRLGIVLIGAGVTENNYPLFRKLRPHGVYYKRITPENGQKVLLDAVAARAAQHPLPYGHWYIDGADLQRDVPPALTCVSYSALDAVRTKLYAQMRHAIEVNGANAEVLRTLLAQIRPNELGLASAPGRDVLNHFEVSLLTEGSGTQIFSTTFVQWAAREAFRRAQPVTLLARFTPRRREQPMNEVLAGTGKPSLDPNGSPIDADMGAYYTWLNQQRLPGAAQGTFLVWFEDHSEALAIGPSLPHGTTDETAISLTELLQRIAV